ncbi:MAG: lysozyme inhibitor LprI family protein [Bacteroidia bacterium]
MKYSDQINCDSQSGSNLEDRICLNLEFQKQDSIMNVLFALKLSTLSDSLQAALKQEHAGWVLERRKISEEVSRGFSGNMLGIIYLQSMVEITRQRIEVLSERE